MKVDLGIWGKLTRVFTALLFLTALAGVLIWYLPLIHANESLRKKSLALENRIKQEEANQLALKRDLKSLEEDPKTVERLAREKLGYAKTNETVVRFEQAPADSSKSRR
jgi:cell division protein FtsB